MTPGARIAAAISVLDSIQAGQPAEAALTRWARGSRFAGSGDRAAVRDHVYDALRHWRSDAVRGGDTTGRARMIGRMRATDGDIAALFNGAGHAPEPLTDAELHAGCDPQAVGDLWDMPDWLVEAFTSSLAKGAEGAAAALTERAPVTLRVNTARTDLEAAQSQLRAEGVETVPNPRAETALTVTQGPRRLRTAPSYLSGLVEVQDAASQAAVLGMCGPGSAARSEDESGPGSKPSRALDFCAGGGGKALALAAQGWAVTAHDIDEGRMRDLPARSTRGGHDIAICPPQDIGNAGLFDLVLCDAPCSGSGTWRRTPEAKWALTPARLSELTTIQAQVLDAAIPHVAPGGRLVYATCSVLARENLSQIEAFLARHSGWQVVHSQNWPIDAWGDGFFAAHLAQV